MVFGSFNLHDEFFAKHQLNYLADIVPVLVHTGQKFNFYDVLVMATDEQVLREQVQKAASAWSMTRPSPCSDASTSRCRSRTSTSRYRP
jgi:hypothetical protein